MLHCWVTRKVHHRQDEEVMMSSKEMKMSDMWSKEKYHSLYYCVLVSLLTSVTWYIFESMKELLNCCLLPMRGTISFSLNFKILTCLLPITNWPISKSSTLMWLFLALTARIQISSLGEGRCNYITFIMICRHILISLYRLDLWYFCCSNCPRITSHLVRIYWLYLLQRSKTHTKRNDPCMTLSCIW